MKAIAYYRVSTVRQGTSGLGLDAQKATVADHLNGHTPIAEYQEVESGRKTDRPELRNALEHCQRTGACLVVAKADRLARNCHFLLALLDSGVEITFCDMPQVSGASGRLVLTMLGGMAEFESRVCSERTKAALAKARERGIRLGAAPGNCTLKNWVAKHGLEKAVGGIKRAANKRAEIFRSTIDCMVGQGLGNTAIAKELNRRGEPSVRGGTWNATGIRVLRARLAAI